MEYIQLSPFLVPRLPFPASHLDYLRSSGPRETQVRAMTMALRDTVAVTQCWRKSQAVTSWLRHHARVPPGVSQNESMTSRVSWACVGGRCRHRLRGRERETRKKVKEDGGSAEVKGGKRKHGERDGWIERGIKQRPGNRERRGRTEGWREKKTVDGWRVEEKGTKMCCKMGREDRRQRRRVWDRLEWFRKGKEKKKEGEKNCW